jgi:hypothetical protein
MSIDEKIIEGKYIFLKDGNQYSEETFTILMDTALNGNYLYKSEILCRVTSGEFLKINVDFETSNSFDPLNIKVHRSLGKNSSTERYKVELKDKQVYYSFSGMDGVHKFDRNVSGKFHISTPAFVTSTLMTKMKKMNAAQVTSYNVLSTQNIWTYEKQFVENNVFLELKSLGGIDIKLNDKDLHATHCQMSEDTYNNPVTSPPADFYLSKYLNIPYKAEFPENLEVRIDKLKVFENEYKNMFKS